MKSPAALIALPLVIFLAIGTFQILTVIQPDSALTGVNGICELLPWWPGCS
jgi:hypothetical protein